MLQRFDELNNLITALREIDEEAKRTGEFPIVNPKRCCDDILDILLIAWAMGNNDANEALGTDIEFEADRVFDDVYHKIDGLTFEDRAKEHIFNGDLEGVIKVVETEVAHDYNSGVLATGQESGMKLMKRWNTQMDDRVRDTHFYLEGMKVPFDADFYTYDGDHAPAPTMFEYAENNVNCRCFITLELA